MAWDPSVGHWRSRSLLPRISVAGQNILAARSVYDWKDVARIPESARMNGKQITVRLFDQPYTGR
jgi:hypothetical protein